MSPTITEEQIKRLIQSRNATVGPKSKNADEIMQELENTPLFMQTLPRDSEEHEGLNALQALVYEGEPHDIAANFKNQGNDCFKAGREGYQDAISYYTRGINVQCQDDELNSTLYCNRAAINLELQNYRRVLNDCAKALQFCENNVKAYYRSAKACLALDKIDEALDCLARGLNLDPNNKPMLAEVAKCEKRREYLQETEERRKILFEATQKEETELMNLIQQRGIQVERSILPKLKSRSSKDKSDIDSDDDDDEGFLISAANYVDPAETSLVPSLRHPQAGHCRVHFDSSSQTLKWPVMFLYPEYKESDFIAEFDEQHTFHDHLEYMFPKDNLPQWDVRREYICENLQVYFESKDRNGNASLFKIDNSMTLLEVLESENYVVMDGVPCFIALVKGSSFTKEFRRNYVK